MQPDATLQLEAEIALLQRVGRGDRASFDQLYERFVGILFSVAYRILNQSQAAEDVLQEVFVQIWEKAPLYDPSRGKPMTWAITLTRNKAIDQLRSTQRRSRLLDDATREVEPGAELDWHHSADALADGERNLQIRQALQRLPDDYRTAIELAFFKSMTQSEIAERLNQPLGTIKARIRRGMLKLRELVDPPEHL